MITRQRPQRLMKYAAALMVAAALLGLGTTTGCGGAGSSGSGTTSANGGGVSSGGSPAVPGVPALGIAASLNGKQVFPADNPWNQRVDTLPIDAHSDAIIAHIGRDQPLHPDFGSDPTYGIPYIVVSGSTPAVTVPFLEYPDESDPGPYPLPANAPVEPGNDRHVLVVDRDHWKLYELYHAAFSGGRWTAGNGAVFDLNSDALRPAGWTSADAGGLPIFAGLARYDEVAGQGVIKHALRFTVENAPHGYIAPARHLVGHSEDPTEPAMGMRFRLKASVNISQFPPQSRVILQALKTYGMIVADEGSNWFISGTRDNRWDDNDLSSMKSLTGADFEVVQTGVAVTQ